MLLRPYQSDLETSIYSAWDSGARNVLAVLPTGAGKTIIFAKILADHRGRCVAIAHRQELVGQISMALARRGVKHRILGPINAVKHVVDSHMADLGESFYLDDANCAVAGVDTIGRRAKDLGPWLSGVTLWVQDEAHHILTSNKWGKAVSLMPDAKGLGVTATPVRADGNGLGRAYEGVIDRLVVGPGMCDIINDGYLTNYKIYCPDTKDLNLEAVPVTPTGDYSAPKLRTAVRKSHIVGDVVTQYLKHAPGRLGITFCTDVETATDVADKFNAAGVPARAISHKTPDHERSQVLKQFRAREVMELVNVDLFGEGFDLPAVEVVSFARPTHSYGVYVQQFGRGLRVLSDTPVGKLRTAVARREAIAASDKPFAIIIDHVGNVIRHGLPDIPQTWSLTRLDRKHQDNSDVIPLSVCPNCTQPYERTHRVCPWCGYHPKPQARSAPRFVDGDLHELDAETLAQMRGDIARVDMTPDEFRAELEGKHCPRLGVLAHVKRHASTQEAQGALRAIIEWWAGIHRATGKQDSEIHRRFYHRFGIDILSACALRRNDAIDLAERITGRF